jgi:hypothetical protein
LEVKVIVVFIRLERANQFGKFGMSAGTAALFYRQRRDYPAVISETASSDGGKRQKFSAPHQDI